MVNDLLHDDVIEWIEHEEHVLIGLHLVIRSVAVHDLKPHVAGAMPEAADVLLSRMAKFGGELNAHDLPKAAGSRGEQQHAPLACAEVDEDAAGRDW